MFDPVSLLILGGMMVVFWLFFLRPQQNQQKLAKQFQEGIEKGTKVVTTGGIHGKIVKADEGSVLMEIDNNVKMRIERSAISAEMTKAAYGDTEKKAEEGK